MPHIYLRYSANIAEIDFIPVLKKIHTIMTEIADIKGCKGAAIKLDDYLIANGDPNQAIIYLEIALLAGRTDEMKEKVARKLIALLNEYFKPILAKLKLSCEPTIEFRTLENYYL